MSQDKKKINDGICYAFCFMPISLYVYGWFAEDIEYDIVEIYLGEDKIGNAETYIECYNVLLHCGNITNSSKGWRFYVDYPETEALRKNITVVAKKSGKKRAEIFTQVKGISIQETMFALSKFENCENNILVVPGASNKIPMLNEIAGKMKEFNFITLIESVPEDKIMSNQELLYNIEKQFDLRMIQENLQIFCMPLLFVRNKFLAKRNVTLKKEHETLLAKNIFLYGLADAIREKFPNMEKSYALYYLCEFYNFISEIILSLNIKGIILWNQFFPLHDIIRRVGEEKKLPIVYSESGVLPGTLAFETLGQMGESGPAVYYDEFKRLPVSLEEIERAKRVLDFLYDSRLNRWAQYGVYKKEQLSEVQDKIMVGRPIIFYAGQNDYESGINPYSENTKKFHSPIFKSSYEAAIFLGELCKKNNWNLIYKRHPMMRRERRNEKLPDYIINYDELDIHDIIDFSGVTITILSQTAYVALIRKKPVVMLGYNQLRGKECTYDAIKDEEIENRIKLALEQGRTQEQTKNFNVHIAQLLKYYLFDDFIGNRTCHYGKSEKELVEYLTSLFK